jgi:hypothetical protein
VTRVAGDIITSVGTRSFEFRKVGNGTATDVDLKDSQFWKRN